jgi:ferric-dicitrate binding protein FerR (iron transport regulator)
MNTSEFERVAKFIQDHVETRGMASEPAQRARFLAAIEHRKPVAARRILVASMATCALVAGIVVNSHRQKHQALTYRIGGDKDIAEIGSYVSAPPATPLGLKFSEGSRVILEPGARGRVARATSHGATIVLENGRASIDVVHRADTDWQVLAGPYVVQVAGTSFEVSYNVATQTFELDMREGVVRVTGPGLAVPGEIRGTQRLLLAPGSSSQPPAASASPTTPTVNEATTPEVNPSDQHANPDIPPNHRTGALIGKRKSADSWNQLGIRAQHKEIVDLAERQGIDNALSSASGPDLFALANAARLTGKHQLADRTYRAVRNRFSSSGEASSAAFFLGRLHENSNSAIAIGWYEQYVAESPAGVWVAEALGRRMVLLNAAQNAAAARKAARDYLQRFATGPYAGFAQKILQP